MTPPTQFGRYQVTGELGRGAMGVVYRGVDPALDRHVAIKVIAARFAGAHVAIEELEARFLREAKVSARVSHPGVVTVFDAGREGDSLYLVMELVDGDSLGDRMARGHYPTKPEALELIAQVAEALGAAHALGVVHRDVKPANIMINKAGRVKVTDFGVAKAIGEGTDLTRTGTVVGSPAYMAPEQVRGETVDGRADLFSLGVVLYELLLRRKPFPADTLTTLIFQILNDDPLGKPDQLTPLGDEAAAFLRSCLTKDPRQRIGDAASFAAGARRLIATVSQRQVDQTAPTTILQAARAATGTAAVLPPAVDRNESRPPPGATVAVPPPVMAGAAAAPPVAATSSVPPPSPAATGPLPPKPLDVTSPTTRIPAAGRPPVAPPPPQAPAAATPSPARRFPWVPVLILAFGIVAVLATLLWLRRTPPPPAGEALLGQVATPVPPASTGIEATPIAPPTAAAVVVVPTASPTAVVPAPVVPAFVVPTATAPPNPRVEPTATFMPWVPPTEPPPPPTPTPPIAQTFTCQKGAKFNVSPEDAEVWVEGKKIGIADDWDNMGGGKIFNFPQAGTYYVHFVLKGYKTTWIKIVVKPDAKDEIADVDTEVPET